VTFVYYALPAVVLLAALLLGHYPGERLILAATTARCRRCPRHAARSAALRPALPSSATPRGGDLLARALAGRAPPRVGLTQCPSMT
jgi:hypothetical protein